MQRCSTKVKIRGSTAARIGGLRAPRFAARQMRRVVVQVHISRAGKSGGASAFNTHIKYHQRDGIDREGHDGELYDRHQNRSSDKGLLKLLELK